jgi:hypothetical protein
VDGFPKDFKSSPIRFSEPIFPQTPGTLAF